MVVTDFHDKQKWKLMKEKRLFVECYNTIPPVEFSTFIWTEYMSQIIFDNKYQFRINSS